MGKLNIEFFLPDFKKMRTKLTADFIRPLYNHTTMATTIQQFEAAILRIRDILRRDGITGMDSMKHCTLYMAARYLTAERLKALKIPERFGWQSLLALSREGLNEGEKTKNRELSRDRIFNNGGADCLVNHFDHLFKTTEFVFRVSARGHSEIMEVLAPINLEHIKMEKDLLGWVYEQHLAKGSSAARDLGQFFTDRFITAYMTVLCDPKKRDDGSIESVCDPTMGTGGFLTSAVHHLTETHGVTEKDWEKNKDRIHGCDIDRFVGSVASINLFMETHGVVFPNVAYRDSLHSDLTALSYDVILANMPFGVKGLKYADVCQRVKDLKLNGTKSEPLFLQLMMVALASGGRCAVVVPDGMLVNTSKCHNETRKYLLDHFELKRVIKMTGKFFMNTGIKPSILFFENTGKPTTAVEFWSVVKDDKDMVNETMVLSVPREQFNDSCVLDVHRYQEINAPMANPTGFPMVNLEDTCNYLNGKTLVSTDKISGGEYDVMGGGMDYVGKTNKYNREGETVSISKSGASAGFVAYHNKKYWAGDCMTITPKDINTLSIKFLYYYLKLNNNLTMEKTSGSTIPHCKWEDISNIKIPLPSRSIQDEIVAMLDIIYNNAKSANTMVANVKVQMLDVLKSINMKGFETNNLVDVLQKAGTGKTNSTSITNSGVVPFYGCTNVVPSGSHDTYDFDDKEYFLFAKSGGNSKTPISYNLGIGRFHLVKGRSAANIAVFQYKLKPDLEQTVSYSFLYWILFSKLPEIQSFAKYTTGNGNIDIDTMMNSVKIPIPPLDFQQSFVDRLSALESQLIALETLSKQSEDNGRFILDSYLKI